MASFSSIEAAYGLTQLGKKLHFQRSSNSMERAGTVISLSLCLFGRLPISEGLDVFDYPFDSA